MRERYHELPRDESVRNVVLDLSQMSHLLLAALPLAPSIAIARVLVLAEKRPKLMF
jgi:hypothetical protein